MKRFLDFQNPTTFAHAASHVPPADVCGQTPHVHQKSVVNVPFWAVHTCSPLRSHSFSLILSLLSPSALDMSLHVQSQVIRPGKTSVKREGERVSFDSFKETQLSSY